jgi:hypothetical protein
MDGEPHAVLTAVRVMLPVHPAELPIPDGELKLYDIASICAQLLRLDSIKKIESNNFVFIVKLCFKIDAQYITQVNESLKMLLSEENFFA